MIGTTKNISDFYRRLIHTFLLCMFFPVTAYSQTMSVASFMSDEKDLTANTHGTMRLDLNGDKCALIKIETTQHNFTFDVGYVGITEVEKQNANHPGEIWLYVPHGVKCISIQHPLLGTIRDYDFGLRVKPAKTYILKLTTDQVNTTVVDYSNSQYLVLDVYPKDAEVYFNGIQFELNSNGKLEIPLSFGIHNYRVTAKGYHTFEGNVVIKDKENKQNLSVRLKQAFGYFTVNSPTDEFNGADVYVDDASVGKLPLNRITLESGNHNVKIYKELYAPYSADFTIADSSFVSVTPVFEPNFANVTIMTADEAEIFDNGNLIGVGKWQGRLEAGNHTIEVKKAGHRTVTKSISFVCGERRMISIEAPTPIYGFLKITSSPSGAEVFIDGKEVGVTPVVNSRLLVGEHEIELRKEGYRREIEVVDIVENEISTLSKELVDYCGAKICANVAAEVYIDGVKQGVTPYTLNLVAGTYTLELKAEGYSSFLKKIRLDATTEDIHVKMHRNLVSDTEIYVQAGYNPVSFQSWDVGIGVYLLKLNLELNYTVGMPKKEKVDVSYGALLSEPKKYIPAGFNFKLGYGLRCSNRMRITPQIGMQFISLKEDFADFFNMSSNSDFFSSYARTASMTFGARMSLAILPWLGFSVSPEYALPIYRSEGYKALSDISSDINRLNRGFYCTFNVNVFI